MKIFLIIDLLNYITDIYKTSQGNKNLLITKLDKR